MSTYDMNTRTAPLVDSESELRRLWAAHVCNGLSYRRRRRRRPRRLGYEISQGQVGYVSLQGTWTRLNKANSSHPSNSESRFVLHPPLLHKIYAIVSLSSSPQWTLTRDSRPAWKRRLGEDEGEQRLGAQLVHSHFRSLN